MVSELQPRRVRLPELAHRVYNATLNLLLPPRCMRCGDAVSAAGAICGPCWAALAFLAPPCCACCGIPFEHEAAAGTLCGACTRERPVFNRCRSALRYDDESRGLILAFKHGDRTQTAPLFGRWMAVAGAELLAEADLIVPVPLHWTRLLARRFNQSALLAQRIGQEAGVRYAPNVLVRRKRTRSQGRLTRVQRRENVQAAFAVSAGGRAAIAGRRVLLVDDVLTTGATVTACARVLGRAGAEAVDILTLARVVRPVP